MDILLFNAGECNDALRDREFYIVRGCADVDSAIAKLAQYFTNEGMRFPVETANDYEVMLTGENLQDPWADQPQHSYLMYVIG